MLNAIRGYRLPFVTTPVQFSEPKEVIFNNKEQVAIGNIIKDYILSGAIVESKEENKQFVSRVFTVPKPNGGLRFVIDLRKLNDFIDCPHFKMEDYRTASSIITQNCFMTVIDLKDAYHQIPIHKDYYKFLKFRFNQKLYAFTVLPFGLNIAPRLYTKVMRPVFSYLRKSGYTSVYYLDDSILFGKDKADCEENLKATSELMHKLGLRVNFEKSQLKPSQQVKFLGFYFDSTKLCLTLPKGKQDKITDLCKYAIGNEAIKIQKMSEIIGTLVSACPAVAYSQIHVRVLEICKEQALKNNNNDYSAKMKVTVEAKADLTWWIKNCSRSKFIPRDEYDQLITSDASLSGYGAYTDKGSVSGQWSKEEKGYHINELELLALYYGLNSLMGISNVHILARLDNTTAIAYINRQGGCHSSGCLRVAQLIWTWCERKNNTIVASYINTRDNYIADELSRLKSQDTSDFQLGKKHFEKLCKSFGNVAIDLFASKNTKQCSRYVSWLPDPFCEAVDAFTLRWNEYFFAFPPFNLVGRVLRKIENEQAKGIVVVPDWPTQYWYPRFLKMAVSNIITLRSSSDLLFCPYDNRSHHLSSRINLLGAVLSGKKRMD